jgi:hypothetical protein
VDLRGVHVLPVQEVVGLRTGEQTVIRSWTRDGVEVDLVTHDLAKFCLMLLQRNGYVLEQVLSPLIVHSSPLHEELRALAPGCVTRNHAHHYLGFARTQRRLFERTGELKPLLYAFRVLLTGIHLMRTGVLDADLTHLLGNGPAYLADLVAAKRAAEHGALPAGTFNGTGACVPDPARLAADLDRLTAELEEVRDASHLQDEPSAGEALHDLVVRTRLSQR